MASSSMAIFSSLRWRRSPTMEAFLAPVHLPDAALLRTLASLSTDLVSGFSDQSMFFQGNNSRSLIRKIKVCVVLLDYLNDSACNRLLPSAAILCFKELYLLMYRSKLILDYCSRSSKLWLLLQNHAISGHFHDLNKEISTLLDVFPVGDVKLSDDVREQVELLHKQCRSANLYIDEHDEELRIRFFKFLDQFENGVIPDLEDLRFLFIDRLKIVDAKGCRAEIEFLEEQIVNHEADVEPTASLLNGFVALTRYCRFLLFGFEEDEALMRNGNAEKPRRRRGIGDTVISVPKDFCCPITLDLMQDPVVISTGQTYDRCSISRWIEDGHCSCPKTGQMLACTRLVPNRALRNLITQWCTAHGIPYDPLENTDASAECFVALPSNAAMEANKATTSLLINQLANGSQGAKTIAAREIRFLSKTWKENRAFIAEAGAIPHLCKLLSSPNPVAQINSVTAMLNLSIYDKNKTRIIDETGCLGWIVDVLRFGHTMEARENAAATLFSLSAVHEYKKRIADEGGAIEALSELLRHGTSRGKKDAVTALFNISTHTDNCARIIESGAITTLVEALGSEVAAEEAAGSLALIVRQSIGSEAVAREDMAVSGLMGMMRCGTARGKENAVAALLELCRNGGTAVRERVVKAPALGGLVQALLFTGTKRARRKAASLARVFQRIENGAALHYGGLGVGYRIASNSGASFASEVSMPTSISVPAM